MPKLDHETILLAFAVVTGLAIFFQTVLLLAITFAVRKTARVLREDVETLRSAVMPVVYDTRDLMANSQIVLSNTQEFISEAQGLLSRVAPKIEAATGELAEIAQGLRMQTDEMQSAALEIVGRVRQQGNRLDEMCTNLLDSLDSAGGFVANAVGAPVRQLSRIMGTVKAVVESLAKPVASQ